MLEIERELYNQGYVNIAGVDEAGRGPLAGPVFAAAVIMDAGKYISEIKDSKKLTPKMRDKLFDYITENAVAYSVCCVDEGEIDRINILNATYKAMAAAVEQLSVRPDFVLIDGNSVKGISAPHKCIVKGDAKSYSIAAASIMAKVSRDRFITEYDKLYPEYNFKKHKGYGTAEHIAAIVKYGLSPIHRKSFTKKFIKL